MQLLSWGLLRYVEICDSSILAVTDDVYSVSHRSLTDTYCQTLAKIVGDSYRQEVFIMQLGNQDRHLRPA